MSRPLIIDAFPIHDELELLECRLTELYDAVDHFVAVEANVTHQDTPKPYYITENIERFDQWSDKLIVVRATDLPTAADAPDPWAREHAQREWIQESFASIPHIRTTDIIMQSDVDEIPRALHARNVRPGDGLTVFGMRGHFHAVDWLYPHVWQGTVAGTVRTVLGMGPTPFANMRTARTGYVIHPSIPTGVMPDHMTDAGWHLSWLPNPGESSAEAAVRKVESFCHPEVRDQILASPGLFAKQGIHVDGVRMKGVDVNDEWPEWITAGNAPQAWYRPR